MAAPFGGVTISTLLLSFGSVAHKTMASDSTPRIFVGFMFATRTTRALSILSIGMCFTNPEQTCKGLSPLMLMFST